MKFITIQNKKILEELEEKSIYNAKIQNCDSNQKKEAYEFMMKFYKYKSCPIFLAPEGYNVEFYGANFDDNSIAIELDIPESELHYQEYYEWSDFIYFLENQKEFMENTIYKNIFSFGEDVLSQVKKLKGKTPYQATTDLLKKEWIVSISENLDKIDELHNGSGGNNVLKELIYYI